MDMEPYLEQSVSSPTASLPRPNPELEHSAHLAIKNMISQRQKSGHAGITATELASKTVVVGVGYLVGKNITAISIPGIAWTATAQTVAILTLLGFGIIVVLGSTVVTLLEFRRLGLRIDEMELMEDSAYYGHGIAGDTPPGVWNRRTRRQGLR